MATRYSRRERPVSVLVALFGGVTILATYFATSALPAAGVAAVVIVALRAPLVRSRVRLRLRTDDDPETVADAFAGPTPPVFALQWGIANEVSTDGDGATYTVSYLLGLRSAEVTVHNRTNTAPDGGRVVESELQIDGRPWASATTEIRDADDHTTLQVTYASDRRFGLRRLPQLFVAKRYRDEALAAQGYTVVERDAHLGR